MSSLKPPNTTTAPPLSKRPDLRLRAGVYFALLLVLAYMHETCETSLLLGDLFAGMAFLSVTGLYLLSLVDGVADKHAKPKSKSSPQADAGTAAEPPSAAAAAAAEVVDSPGLGLTPRSVLNAAAPGVFMWALHGLQPPRRVLAVKSMFVAVVFALFIVGTELYKREHGGSIRLKEEWRVPAEAAEARAKAAASKGAKAQ